ncbi:YqgE/AlgH family protein [Acidomonas methanolica]|uniref:YqgE/AlgH family protein n=1 Tax=Acidomonas methanolica TaxID=437 RepID=UPI002119C23E|nr:YqgE/AlgH family protein [Acidomonas methanolica]MCQ9156446.1 YqgE/AlgH family protein [Acidomonas methanolica]
MTARSSDTPAPDNSDADPDADSLAGLLLVASPSLSDTEFARSVIYLCLHTAESGAMGVIVNKRQAQPGQDALFEQLGIEPTPPRRRIGICNGGPLDPHRGFVLHSADWSGKDSIAINEDTRLSADLDVLRRIAAGEGPRRALLALGHAAWEAGQLENELIHGNAWFVVQPTSELIFGADHGVKWRRALASLDLDPLAMPDAVGHA